MTTKAKQPEQDSFNNDVDLTKHMQDEMVQSYRKLDGTHLTPPHSLPQT